MATALATTGVFGGQHEQSPDNSRAVFPASDLTVWSSWPHEGHRLWALMSDAFWVYVYKVHRCPNISAHDWTLCPYAHRRELARRRDPRSYAYLPVACPDYRASNRHHLRTGSRAAPTCMRGLTQSAFARACATPARRARARSASLRTALPSSDTRTPSCRSSASL
jgi:hypothetical protein